MYKVNVMIWGDCDPMHNQHRELCAERMHIWKCNVNRYGIITSCKLIRENCYDLTDTKGLRQVFYNAQDISDYVKICEQLKKEAFTQ